MDTQIKETKEAKILDTIRDFLQAGATIKIAIPGEPVILGPDNIQNLHISFPNKLIDLIYSKNDRKTI